MVKENLTLSGTIEVDHSFITKLITEWYSKNRGLNIRSVEYFSKDKVTLHVAGEVQEKQSLMPVAVRREFREMPVRKKKHKSGFRRPNKGVTAFIIKQFPDEQVVDKHNLWRTVRDAYPKMTRTLLKNYLRNSSKMGFKVLEVPGGYQKGQLFVKSN